jgi:hypothetical protein
MCLLFCFAVVCSLFGDCAAAVMTVLQGVRLPLL